MTEQIREFLQSENYINMFIIGLIIIINILNEVLILANENFDELIKNNKEIVSKDGKDNGWRKPDIGFGQEASSGRFQASENIYKTGTMGVRYGKVEASGH